MERTACASPAENVLRLRREIASLARDPKNPPALLPVTKTRPPETIASLGAAGVTQIGENRVQELLEKYPRVSGDFSIHLIGRLQTNKIKYIIDKVCLVQSLDRPELARALGARAQAAGLTVSALIEVNIGGEAQKGGVPEAEAFAFARFCAALPGLSVRGLMTVMPLAPDPETLRPLFRRMRALFDRLGAAAIEGVRMETLSMGMSGDWRIAAQEGATMLRLGSAIFGARETGATPISRGDDPAGR